MNRGINGLSFTNNLQVHRCFAGTIVKTNTSGNDSAKVFDCSSLQLQFLAVTKKILRLQCRFAISNLVQSKTDDPAYEENYEKSKHNDYCANNEDDFFSGHLGASAMEVEARKIVEEWCIEEQ